MLKRSKLEKVALKENHKTKNLKLSKVSQDFLEEKILKSKPVSSVHSGRQQKIKLITVKIKDNVYKVLFLILLGHKFSFAYNLTHINLHVKYLNAYKIWQSH